MQIRLTCYINQCIHSFYEQIVMYMHMNVYVYVYMRSILFHMCVGTLLLDILKQRATPFGEKGKHRVLIMRHA